MPGRSKHGTQARVAERMQKAHVKFYKEKGANEAYHMRKKGLDKVPDIELNLFSQRRFSVIDLEKKLIFLYLSSNLCYFCFLRRCIRNPNRNVRNQEQRRRSN